MGQGCIVCGGASEELGSESVGHPGCLGAWRDGAVAHRPQAGVLAETEKHRGQGLVWGGGSQSAAGGD
jgi:hypothetical protein